MAANKPPNHPYKIIIKYMDDHEEREFRNWAYQLALAYSPTHKDTQEIFVDGYMAAVKDLKNSTK